MIRPATPSSAEPAEGLQPLDQRASRILSDAECYALLARGSGGYGRLGINIDDAPVVLPFNFVLVAKGVMLRVGPGSILDAVADEPAVAFEIDGLEWPTAWSVLVQGTVALVRDPLLLELAASSGLTPLIGEPGEVYLQIRASAISGRQFQVGPLARSGPSAPDVGP